MFTFNTDWKQCKQRRSPRDTVRNIDGERNTDMVSTWKTLLISLLLAVNLWNYS